MWKHKNFINLQLCATFKHFYDAGTIGSGTVKFRHYSQTELLPQLATPQNVTADGTTVSWDAVQNATSYAVLADGNEIGTVEGAATDELAGTWVFNDYISPPNGNDVTFNFSFISDYSSFTAIRIVGEDGSLYYMEYIFEDTSLDPAQVYTSSWDSGSGRNWQTIKILSKLSEVTNGSELLTWLQANGTKQ